MADFQRQQACVGIVFYHGNNDNINAVIARDATRAHDQPSNRVL